MIDAEMVFVRLGGANTNLGAAAPRLPVWSIELYNSDLMTMITYFTAVEPF